MKKFVSISDIKIGMFVSGITKSKVALVVKSQGMIKSQTTIDSLASRGILEFEIDLIKSQHEEEGSTASSPPTTETNPARNIEKKITNFEQQQRDLAVADRLYTEAREIHTRFIKKLKNGQAPDFTALQTLSQDIIDNVFDNSDALACLVMLKESSDYLVEHSLNCSILMSLFAKHKGFNEAEIEDLTLAGLLMDCGMALLPQELIEGTEEPSSSDITLLRTHVDIGLELAERFGDLPPVVVDIIANHHERIDQTGYPKQKHADDISVYAKMSSIVDCYDEMLTSRPLRSSTSVSETLEIMKNDPGFDSTLIDEFIMSIGLFPVGSLVQLKSEKLAIVIQRNRRDPLNPVVMTFYSLRSKQLTDSKRIDLKKQNTDKIIASVTPDEFNINLPKFFRNVLLPF